MSSAEESEDQAFALRLTDPKRKLLLKACQHYRASIPIYLQSGAEEAIIIADLIRMLSSAAPSD